MKVIPPRSLVRVAAVCLIGALILLILLGCSQPAQSKRSDKPYYAGKSIEIIVPFKEGGGTDLWARFIGPYLEKHIAGNPRVLVRNMPGGESITGTNWFVASGRTDGTVLLASSATTMFHQLQARSEVRYDFRKLKLAAVTATGGVIFASPSSGIKTVADLRKPAKPLVYGGISPTGLDVVTLLAFDVLGLDVKTVFGFEGKGPSRLAFERGETNLEYQTTAAYQSSVVPLVQERKAVPLMSFGIVSEPGVIRRDPVVPDIPTVGEVYTQMYGRAPEGAAWQAYVAYMTAGYAYQKSLWLPEKAPADAIQQLTAAVERMSNDAEFHAKGSEVLGGYPTFVGVQAESAVRGAIAVPDDVIAYVRKLLATKYGVKE